MLLAKNWKISYCLSRETGEERLSYLAGVKIENYNLCRLVCIQCSAHTLKLITLKLRWCANRIYVIISLHYRSLFRSLAWLLARDCVYLCNVFCQMNSLMTDQLFLPDILPSLEETLPPKNIIATPMKIGFLGLGIMGSGMVDNLLKSGHEVTVWNRTTSKVSVIRASC